MKHNIDQLVKDLNKYKYRNDIKVPILDDFEKTEVNNDNIIFIAKAKDGFIEMFLEDKVLSAVENLESRIEALVNEAKNELKKSKVKVEVAHLKNINTNGVDYYIYIQKAEIEKKTNMQINAYFLEPKNKVIYQLSILSPAYDSTKFIDKYEMNLTIKLITIIETIINNIKTI